jgi:hypothetical protein
MILQRFQQCQSGDDTLIEHFIQPPLRIGALDRVLAQIERLSVGIRGCLALVCPAQQICA